MFVNSYIAQGFGKNSKSTFNILTF